MARPKIEINEEDLKKLASMGCTMSEIAAFFGCSVDTLERRFADVIYGGRERGKTSVRRMLWEQAAKGNTFALRYLVFRVLGENVDETVTHIIEHKEYEVMTDDQLEALVIPKRLS